jgi:gliding motility-associated-like protein
MNKIKFLILSLLVAQSSFAQPANNNCGGATNLIPASGCNPILGNTAGATQSQPGCVGTANDDVWYSFVATAPGHSINVTGNGTFNPVLQVFSGTCGGSSLGCINATGNGGTETFSSTNFIMGITYWIRVYDFGATFPSNTTFNICISDPIVEPPCDPNSAQPSNLPVPCALVPKICQVNGFCGTTQGYYATAGATTLTPYTVNSWPQLTAAFCGSIENNSFVRFEANASTVQLRIYGSCTSGTGIQLLAFSYVNPAVDCGTGPIVTYGCFSPITLNPAPAAGVPVTFTGMVPGQTYYLMIDGFAGAICNYKIGADYGVQIQTNVSPSTSTICLGNTVTLNASGGNGIYAWNPNPDLSASSGASVVATPTNLGLQTYVVNSASTDPACPGTADTALVNVTTIPTPNAGVDDTVCFNPTGVTVINLNGTLSNSTNTKLWQYLPPPGTTPTVTFAPNFTTLNAVVSVNQPGLYKFILRETSPICGAYRDTVDILVMQLQQTLSFNPPACAGQANGSITVTNPDANEYSFDNGSNWQPSNTQSGFAAGTYTVCSRNYLGCQVCSQITVVDPLPVVLTVSNDTIVCENGTATLVASAIGGNTFVYNWNHTSSQLGNQLVSPVTAGYYSVSATNNFGCSSLMDSIYVGLNPPLSGTISSAFAICPGDNAVVTSTASGGSGGPYTHTWSTLAVGTGASHSINETPGSTTSYTVTISDACETTPWSNSMTVTVSPLPQPSFSVLVDSLCSPGVFTVYNTTDPITVQSASWSVSNGQSFTNLDSIVTGPLFAGNYTVALTITSPDGCVNTHTEPNYLVAMQIPNSNFRYSPQTVTALNTTVTFDNLSVGANNYAWSFQDGNPATSSAFNPVVVFPEQISGNYYVDLIVESDFGCIDTSYQIIQIRPEVILYAPNTFTPDGDEFNGTWRVFVDGIDASEFELILYNRWGEVIWINQDPSADWDGTYNGKPVQAGLYNWRIKAKDSVTDASFLWNGHVNVLR